jgi:hypothetical protein
MHILDEPHANVDYQKDVYYILVPPAGTESSAKGYFAGKVVNPSSFSWMAFLFPLFFYGFYRRWSAVLIICALVAFFDYVFLGSLKMESANGGDIIAAFCAGIIAQYYAGAQGMRNKLKFLISKGWKVVGEYEAESEEHAFSQHKDAGIAEIDALIEDQDRQEADSNNILDEMVIQRPTLTGAAKEIEQFSYLRDQGVITEEEFQKKKGKLLKKK